MLRKKMLLNNVYFFFQKTIIPRLKSWIRKVVLEEEAAEEGAVKGINLKPSLAEEAAVAAKAAAAAAADVARASQEMLASKTDGIFPSKTCLFIYQIFSVLNHLFCHRSIPFSVLSR